MERESGEDFSSTPVFEAGAAAVETQRCRKRERKRHRQPGRGAVVQQSSSSERMSESSEDGMGGCSRTTGPSSTTRMSASQIKFQRPYTVHSDDLSMPRYRNETDSTSEDDDSASHPHQFPFTNKRARPGTSAVYNDQNKRLSSSRIRCPRCGEDFAARYYKRHVCAADVATELSSEADDDDVHVRPYPPPCDQPIAPPAPSSDGDSGDDADLLQLRKLVAERLSRVTSGPTPRNMTEEDIRAFFSDPEDLTDTAKPPDIADGPASPAPIDDEDSGSGDDEAGNLNFAKLSLRLRAVLKSVCGVIALWQAKFRIPDTALVLLLAFLAAFLKDLSEVLMLEELILLAEAFPTTAQKLTSMLATKPDVTEYVVCPKCRCLKKYEDCWYLDNATRKRMSRTCDYSEFPNHVQKRFRSCDADLLKVVKQPGGGEKLVPHHTFFYKTLRSRLEEFLARPGYEKACEEWRTRKVHEGVMTDVYDGKIWASFIQNGFLANNRSYCLMLNLDWFQPFDRQINYSIGAIYAVNLNLPRSVRFKQENVFLIGIIPDMGKEPPTNPFLLPLVEEIKQAFDHGFYMKTHDSPDADVKVRVALACVGCDIPAARKLCGFLGHAATVGCSRCLKVFPGDVGEKEYGGFDRENWTARTDPQHREDCDKLRNCETKTQRTTMESNCGSRYSILLELKHYSPIRMCIIDPMHNLFLGTAKQLIRVWQEVGVINVKQFAHIQELVDRIEVPSSLGRIPRKIASKFAGFTADQFKNLILFFSIVSFYDVLKDIDLGEHLECLRIFVVACRILCNRALTTGDVIQADKRLLSFCKKFEELYGSEYVTPNMHLNCHLKECVLDYGPLYSFWLYSFERYNGILGSFPNNNRVVEGQLFRRFERDAKSLNFQQNPHLQSCRFMKRAVELGLKSLSSKGTLAESDADLEFGTLFQIHRMSKIEWPVTDCSWFDFVDYYETSTRKMHELSHSEFRHISSMYGTLYPDKDVVVCASVWKLSHVKLGNDLYGSRQSRTCRSAYVAAFWPDEDGRICTRPSVSDDLWPGVVSCYFLHSVRIDGEMFPHLLANVEWLSPLDQASRHEMGDPVTVWYSSLYLTDGPASFIPVQRIHCKYLRSETERRGRVAIVPRQIISVRDFELDDDEVSTELFDSAVLV